jgi:hypothetical protein
MSADEEKGGPTIFEAAADEEIKDSHWCAQHHRKRIPLPPPHKNARFIHFHATHKHPPGFCARGVSCQHNVFSP